MKTALVTGATSLIGYFLMPRLKAAGYRVIAISRNKAFSHPDIDQLITADISRPENCNIPEADILINLAPLWFLPPLVQHINSLQDCRIIAFSSTSSISKINSSNLAEKRVAENLANAEKALLNSNNKSSIKNITIFRPTLIYGAGLDKNISTIAAWITRFKFFPLIGKADGLRQPVHADDLAKACLQVADNSATHGKIYQLVGAETLTYKEMVTKIFTASGLRPRLFSVPTFLLKPLIMSVRIFPRYKHITTEMAERMNTDLVFNSEPAIRDFGYQAVEFQLEKTDLITS